MGCDARCVAARCASRTADANGTGRASRERVCWNGHICTAATVGVRADVRRVTQGIGAVAEPETQPAADRAKEGLWSTRLLDLDPNGGVHPARIVPLSRTCYL